MSTKIYNGCLLKLDKQDSIQDLFCKMMDCRDKLMDIFNKEFLKKCIQMSVDFYDNLSLHNYDFLNNDIFEFKNYKLSLKQKEKKSCFQLAYMTISSRYAQIKERGERDPFVDFDFAVAVYPIKNKILARYFTEQRVFEDLWFSQKFVKDYHYQNQTDRPENISEKKWDQREKDWDIALEEQCYKNIPSTGSFLFDFITANRCRIYLQSDIWQDINLKNKMIPSFEDRAKFYIFDKAYQIKIDELNKKDKSGYHHYHIPEKEVWEDKKLIEKIQKEVENNLKKDIKISDLEECKIEDLLKN